MKIILSLALVLSCGICIAQTTTEIRQIKGSDVKAMFPKITDSRIYDQEGNVVDSAEARKKVKTFDYTLGWGTPKGQAEAKRMLFKADHAHEVEMEKVIKAALKPKNPKIWEGEVLDLSALANHTDITKLQGKAVVLLFRNNAYNDIYPPINEVIADYIDKGKFEVFAITHLDYDAAMKAQKASPILNAHNIIDAPNITAYYGSENKPLIIVTDAQHKITYSITEGAAMTPRVLNRLLKAL